MQNKQNKKIKIGLVQIACSTIDGSLFIPYSIGLLQSYFNKYSLQASKYEFIKPIVTERSISKAVKILSDADIIAFSTYVWNGKISQSIAESIKQNNPEVTIIFGGPYVPSDASEFLKRNRFIDLLICGEGEIAFMKFLENYTYKAWNIVPGVRYIDDSNIYRESRENIEVPNINSIPSPYLEGVFDHLFDPDTNKNWVGVWETNRGCPYHCTFCEWGNSSNLKLRKFNIDRLYGEINWFSKYKIKLLCCCDANFGLLERDIKIAKQIADNRLRTGYPFSVYVQNAKNSTQRNYEIHKCFVDSGLTTTIGLSFQSLDQATLNNIKRSNINIDSFITLQTLFNQLGKSTYCELILGLPGETYDSFVDGVCNLVENGQHNSIRANNLTVLPNSELASDEYMDLYQIETVSSMLINPGQQLITGRDDTYEIQELVCSTSTMTRHEWASSRVFSWLLSFMYFEKSLWIPMFVYFKLYGVGFRKMIEAVMKANDNYPILKEVTDMLFKQAVNIQQGEPEYFYSKDWLGVFWPVGKYVYLKLLFEDKLDSFYEEFKMAVSVNENVNLKNSLSNIIDQAYVLNHELLKSHRNPNDYSKTISVSYNYLESFEKLRQGQCATLEKNEISIKIISGDSPNKNEEFSFDSWLEEILREGFIYKVRTN